MYTYCQLLIICQLIAATDYTSFTGPIIITIASIFLKGIYTYVSPMYMLYKKLSRECCMVVTTQSPPLNTVSMERHQRGRQRVSCPVLEARNCVCTNKTKPTTTQWCTTKACYICIYVCVYMCIYVYVCVYMCMYVYVCVCMCMCVYVCVCMCMYMYVYVCVCMCMYVCSTSAATQMCKTQSYTAVSGKVD